MQRIQRKCCHFCYIFSATFQHSPTHEHTLSWFDNFCFFLRKFFEAFRFHSASRHTHTHICYFVCHAATDLCALIRMPWFCLLFRQFLTRSLLLRPLLLLWICLHGRAACATACTWYVIIVFVFFFCFYLFVSILFRAFLFSLLLVWPSLMHDNSWRRTNTPHLAHMARLTVTNGDDGGGEDA